MIQFNLCSFADLRRPATLAAVGRAFDADPALRPERIDTRDPIRNRVTSAEAYFEYAADKIVTDDFLFDRRQTPHLGGELCAVSYRLPLPDSAHELIYSTDDEDEPWVREPENLERLTDLYIRVAGAFDAAYGFATDSRMWRQHVADMARAGLERGVVFPTMGPYTDRYTLRDVYWLNYLGPAFLERWSERLHGLGVRQEKTSNGGIVIWATQTPFVFRPDIGFMDYPWKRPFYERLGRDTFYHPGQRQRQYVPTREDHLRHVGAADKA